jgi:hypothetical protein
MMNMYVMLMLMLWDINTCLTPRGVTIMYKDLYKAIRFHRLYIKIYIKREPHSCDPRELIKAATNNLIKTSWKNNYCEKYIIATQCIKTMNNFLFIFIIKQIGLQEQILKIEDPRIQIRRI